jgi:hypothetical protein
LPEDASYSRVNSELNSPGRVLILVDERNDDGRLLKRLDRRGFLRAALAASAGGAALYTVGCGSGSSDATRTPPRTGTVASPTVASGTPSATNPSGITPSMLTSEFVANHDNRFAVGLVNAQSKLVKDANVHLRFFTLAADGKTGTLRGEGDAQYVELNVEGAHVHDSSGQADIADNTVSFYEVNTPFDAAGKWVAEITATPDDGSAPSQVQAAFTVLDKTQTPWYGEVPPASHNDTTATNPNPASLCSRQPPCPLHDKVIADVLGKGKPLVVQFSTPAFCQTRFCGPVLELLLKDVPSYQDKINFVHIEVWQDFLLQKYRPAMGEWHLTTEPWTFFMGSDGKVVERFESIFSEAELKAALDKTAAA